MTTEIPTLSLCVITGNNEDMMGRFLDNFQPLADEVIVVRACGNQEPDNSLRMAQERGCITGEYHNAEGNDWPHTDDFGAARQKATDLATGAFCMWADTDDIINKDSVEQIRQLLPDLVAKDVDGVLMRYVVPEDGVINWRERIWRRGSAKWINPVHECLEFKEGSRNIRFEGAEIVHASGKRSASRDERNLRILESIPEETRTPSQTFHTFQTLIGLNRRDEAIQKAMEFVQLPDTGINERYEGFFQLGSLSDSEETKCQCFLQALATDPRRPEAYFELGLAHCLANPEAAEGWTYSAMQIKEPTQFAPWNLRRTYFGHLGVSIRAMALRANKRHAEADALQDNHFIRNGAKISLLHATRGRAGQAWRTKNDWIRTADNPDAVEHIFAVDADDPHAVPLMNAKAVLSNGDGGPVSGWNAAAKASKGEVLVQLSDDFAPFHGWDTAILDAIGDTSKPAVLAVSDGNRNDDLLCMAILTRKRLMDQGYMFHPEFFSMHSDNWFSKRAFEDGVVIDARDSIVFEHLHPAFGKAEMDETYARSNSEYNYKVGAGIMRRLESGKKVSTGVHGWFDFRQVYDMAAKHLPDGGIAVEVGTWKGQSVMYLHDRLEDLGKDVSICAIDHFKGDPEAGIEDTEQECRDNLADRNVEVVKADSSASAADFADGSVDFAFIDGAHDYEHALADIKAWQPKVKPDGILAGHDIDADGVQKALDELGIEYAVMGRCWITKQPENKP